MEDEVGDRVWFQNLVAVRARNEMLADEVRLCVTQEQRSKGVLGISQLKPSQGALLDMRGRLPIRFLFRIHMVGVPFRMAVAWVGEDTRIIDRFLALPGRFYTPPKVPAYVLELHASHFDKLTPSAEVSWELSGFEAWKGDESDLLSAEELLDEMVNTSRRKKISRIRVPSPVYDALPGEKTIKGIPVLPHAGEKILFE
jgi:uncharacterized membrane protein (UPF0127 family)